MSSSYDPAAGGPGPAPGEPGDREQELREAPLGEVLSQTAQDAADLFRGEVALAKAEIAQKGKQLGAGAGMIIGAAVAGLAAVGALTAFLILLIGAVTGYIWAAIIVTVLWGIVAFILVKIGQNRIKRAVPPAPSETAESVKEDVQWVKTQTQSGRR